jgi:hypothetical protein
MIDFLGIGGQRCGTTWLFVHLRRHPHVRFPGAKEIHYWDRYADQGPGPWLDLFPPTPRRVKQGEITPAYAILEPEVVRTVASAAPSLKLILNIRNPIARAWSAAQLCRQRCLLDPDEVSDAWYLDVIRSRRSWSKGMFSETITTWRDSFSPEQLMLVFYDDILSDPAGVLRRVASHIGVQPTVYLNNSGALSERRGVVSNREVGPSPRVLAVLRDGYRDEIGVLEKLTGRDLGSWFEWDGA